MIAPIEPLGSWIKELTEENEEYIPAYLASPASAKLSTALGALNYPAKRCWALVNYECLRLIPEIAFQDWDLVILDESTKIKNPKAQVTQVCLQGFRYVKYRAILSGLPNPESDLDFHCQMQFLNGQFMGCDNYYKFRERWFEPKWDGSWGPKTGTKSAIYATLKELAFTLTRADVKIGSRKIKEVREISLSKDVYANYLAAEASFSYEAGDYTNATQWGIVLQNWLARMAGGFKPAVYEKDDTGKNIRELYPVSFFHDAKLKELKSLMTGELKKEQVVIWARFTAEINAISKLLNDAGITTVSLTGETDATKRLANQKLFQSGKARAIVLQIKLGKFGIDLSNSDTAIYYSNGYSLEDRAQSEDRIISPVKQQQALYIDLVSKNTVDEDVIAALNDKSADAQTFMWKMRQYYLQRTGRTK